MAAKPVQFRELASFDLESASGYEAAEADVATAIRLVDSVEATARRIGRNPRLGSLRFAYELAVPDLRVVAAGRFPYLLFYLERKASVDVWRLLHTSRDIPASLQDPDA
ncbi:MAG: type II toxin-antitoxin system RelE/ParE family toxin [Ilumatobacter sp.]|uniref:type II toxin-antitoxin system RelE/ParE family toxin n=1 Tax=Ilumatobacter sp. TaxID=1967498 RepID=UPI003296982B